MKISNDIIKRQVKLVETYLLEFCEVNGVQESELDFVLVSCEKDNSLMVVNSDDQRDVKFGVRVNTEAPFIGIFGEFTDDMGKFPKTVKLIEKYGGDTGNTTTSSGEQ